MQHRWIAVAFAGLALADPPARAQEVPLQGTVLCFPGGRESAQRPTRSAVVWPARLPQVAAITTDYGFYRLSIPYRAAADQTVTLRYRGQSNTVETQPVFVSKQSIRAGRVVVVDTKKMRQPCEVLEADYTVLERIRDSLTEGTAQLARGDNVASGTGGVLNAMGELLSLLVQYGAGAAEPPDSMKVDTLPPQNLQVTPSRLTPGRFLGFARGPFSYNIGFAFTPSGNLDEAVFWNASALAMQPLSQVALQTDYHRFLRLTAFGHVTGTFTAGVGAFLFRESEERTVTFPTDTLGASFSTSEWLLVAAMSWRPTSSLAIGVAPKLMLQRLSQLAGVARTVGFYRGGSTSTSYDVLQQTDVRSLADMDLSASADILPALSLGFSALNILGSRLLVGDSERSSRAFGLGARYALGRVNLGCEVVVGSDRPVYALGASLVPLNHVTIQAGYSTLEHTLSLGVSFRTLTYRYAKDQRFGGHHSTGVEYIF